MKHFGTSPTTLDFITAEQAKAMRPETIVDFGAGGGKYGRLLRSALGDAPIITAVEGFPPTAENLRHDKNYNAVDGMLIREWFVKNTARYNLAIFGDVLEHLTRREIYWTLRQAARWFDEIIVVVPLFDVDQGTVHGNELENHRAFVDGCYFDWLKPREKHIVKTETYTMMSVRIDKTCIPGTFRTLSRHDIFRWWMTRLERIGLARVTWHALKRLGLIR